MKIKLNDHVSMDLDRLIESRLLVQANSGGGKSWAIRRIIEQAFGHVQIIVIDPEGEFGNMRSELDFVYVGKGGDAPAEPRSAALLAKRLLELKASAIIDLYELSPQERKNFVKIFCESMVNAPKELWHDCLVIIDEAHVFAPEKSDSEALGPVIDLATRGRKRGYCVVLASQRISKLHKDAAAECNNKLIGRTALDIDRKRAGEELGLTSREEILALRNLVPGEFMAFGPALGLDVQSLHIGDVRVKPAKRGISRAKAPAPSSAVKKILAKLADLPQEAEAEARSVAELQTELRIAKGEIRRLEKAPQNVSIKGPIMRGFTEKEVDARIRSAMHKRDLEWEKVVKGHVNFEIKIQKVLEGIAKEATNAPHPISLPDKPKYTLTPSNLEPATFLKSGALPIADPTPDSKPILLRGSRQTYNDVVPGSMVMMAEGERKILNALGYYPDGITREHVSVLTDYKTSTRNRYLFNLQQKGYVIDGNGVVAITETGKSALGPIQPLPEGRDLAEHYLRVLPDGEAKILQFLLSPEIGMGATREQISEATELKTSTRNRYIYNLRIRQLVNLRGDLIKASDHLFD